MIVVGEGAEFTFVVFLGEDVAFFIIYKGGGVTPAVGDHAGVGSQVVDHVYPVALGVAGGYQAAGVVVFAGQGIVAQGVGQGQEVVLIVVGVGTWCCSGTGQ